jgi:hypothetical protein
MAPLDHQSYLSIVEMPHVVAGGLESVCRFREHVKRLQCVLTPFVGGQIKLN